MVSISYADDISQDHVGGVCKNCELKLDTKNIEKYYYINSNYHDYDRSIGIAMIKGTGVAKISEADEFIDTCDIVSVQSTGSIQIVGNKRTFIKLANKDMIYPEKLEAIYLTSKWIDSIWIYGDENFEFLVALVHLNRKHFELTVPDPDVQNMKEMTQNSLEAIANEYKLKPHEKLSKLYFIDDKFSISNGKYFK